MARPQTIQDDDVLARLGLVFRDVGYAGASLEMLATATGLKKASLYHRFPGGKQQMANTVLSAALAWFETEIINVLRGDLPPPKRIAIVGAGLDSFYSGGVHACLLNMLTSPRDGDGPFSEAIKAALEAIIDGFTVTARDAGHDLTTARARAERAVMLLQGSLVLARGLGSTAPFQTMLAGLADEILLPQPRPDR